MSVISLKQLYNLRCLYSSIYVFQVFFDTLYLTLSASCLLASATYRNAQLMDSLLSYFSSKHHIVFSEPVITVLYCHSTFFLALTSTLMDIH